MDTYVYSIEDDAVNAKTLYVNVTNRCTNNCVFCIRSTADDIKGKRLWLVDENITSKDIIEQFENFNTPEEVVFCGYGEPFYRLDLIKGVSVYLKYKHIKVRVNTNGLGNIINHGDIMPEIANIVDEISISLNAPTKEQYNEISKPIYDNAFDEMLRFAKACVENEIDTTLTVVDGHPSYKLDLQACEEIANSIGAKFRVRQWISDSY